MSRTTISEAEVNKFERMAEDWWNPYGRFKPLHDLTPVRLEYIVELAKQHFNITSLVNIKALDVGCGGGIITESMARLGVKITGIDASKVNIDIAKDHSIRSGLEIDYQNIVAEDIKEKYQLILALEVIEHVEDIDYFIKTCFGLLQSEGLIIFSTMNKTITSYLQSIIAAEYILKWLPKGTHNWNKFVKPSQLNKLITEEGGSLVDFKGLSYSIINNKWSLSQDVSNNYFIAFTI
jgi:2-polyprenyl-6-hydroxyphenyl methylase/3-demethylubiquinone-9 3-methyltransferase